MTDDVRKLLGGYATGTLTEDEKKVLFDAALHDDALFAALADEHALKEMLDDSSVRAHVLQATEEPRFSVAASLREWFENPKSKALVATGAVLIGIIGFHQVRQSEPSSSTTTVAELRRPAESAPAPTVPSSPPAQAAEPRQRALADSAVKREERPVAGETKPNKDAAAETTVAFAPPPPSPLSAAAPQTAAPAGVSPGSLAVITPEFRSADSAQSVAAGSARPTSARVGALQRAAGTSVTPLRYELLRRDAAGEFQAVPPDYLFNPGDVLRVRVTSSRDGAVGITADNTNSVVSHAIVANTWTEVPQSGGIAVTANTTKLVVAFAPSPADALAGNLVETDQTRAKQKIAPPVSLEIPIRQKKP